MVKFPQFPFKNRYNENKENERRYTMEINESLIQIMFCIANIKDVGINELITEYITSDINTLVLNSRDKSKLLNAISK